jgi:HEAT repeat protein
VVPTLLGGISTEYSDKIDQRQVNDRTNEKIALALAKLGDPSAKPALIKLLDSKAANVLNAAIKAESVFKDPDAVPGLMVIVKNDKLAKNIRSDAIKVLGDIGDPRAVPALVLAMYIEKQGTVYPEASYALMQIGAPAVPELTKALERKNPEVEAIGKKFIVGAIEAKASDTLGWICDKSAYDPLARVLVKVREDNPIATAKTAYALARLQDRRAVGIISKYIENEEDPSVRQHYTLALNMLGDHSVMPILFKASKKPDVEKYRKEGANDLELNMLRESRNDIIRTIARLCNDKDLPEWLKMEKAEKDDKVKKTWEEYRPMVEAAKECGDKFDCWNGKLGDPNKLVREKAAYSIGRIGSDQAAEVLVKLIDDKEQGVQYAALQGIYNMAEKNGARLYDLVVIKEGQMDKAKREKMADDLKLLKLRLAKAGGKK